MNNSKWRADLLAGIRESANVERKRCMPTVMLLERICRAHIGRISHAPWTACVFQKAAGCVCVPAEASSEQRQLAMH